MKRLAAALLLLACLAAAPASAQASAPTVRVAGNRLVNGQGHTLRLLGVNRSGSEYACIQGWGIFEGPVGARAIAAIRRWKANAVRVPLNEDCWLGINGVDSRYGGWRYRRAIKRFVSRLHEAGLVAVLELHWSAPGRIPATGQWLMANRSHTPAFWSSVARAFRRDRSVVFDLVNEPHDISWRCWRDGCTVDGWRLAGMQRLVNAVRATGARQPIMVAGLAWANDLSRWLAWRPYDPLKQIVASFHVYNFNSCRTPTCWSATVGRVAGSVPVVTGEIGEDDCAHGFIDRYMRWADARRPRMSYLGWTWNVWGCGEGPALISAYDGTPTPYGIGFRRHLAELAR